MPSRRSGRPPNTMTAWMTLTAEAPTKSSDVVLLVCDGHVGRRSASMAIVLEHLLQTANVPAQVKPVTHMALPLWTDRGCAPCATCVAQHPMRTMALHAARAMWDELHPEE